MLKLYYKIKTRGKNTQKMINAKLSSLNYKIFLLENPQNKIQGIFILIHPNWERKKNSNKAKQEKTQKTHNPELL